MGGKNVDDAPLPSIKFPLERVPGVTGLGIVTPGGFGRDRHAAATGR